MKTYEKDSYVTSSADAGGVSEIVLDTFFAGGRRKTLELTRAYPVSSSAVENYRQTKVFPAFRFSTALEVTRRFLSSLSATYSNIASQYSHLITSI
jgi:membrane-bound lytic murein transglycosylase B